MSVQIAQLSVEHHESGFAIEKPSPRLSWRYKATDDRDWEQSSYEVIISRDGKEEQYSVESAQSVLVPWPAAPLLSRERAQVKVRSTGKDGSSTPWASIHLEVALLSRSDWSCAMITGPAQAPDAPKTPFRLRKRFSVPSAHTSARLYATAFGIYEVEINGQRVGDQLLTPGWTSYDYHLNYQTYDISQYLCDGENEIVAHVAEGWYAGRLGKACRNIWGDRMGFLGQVEIDGEIICASDETWSHLKSSVLESEIYNGEVVDTNPDPSLDEPSGAVTVLPFPQAQLVSSEAPPVRRIQTVKPIEIITTPSGKRILDFGQNLVGHVRIEQDLNEGAELGMRHAEVLENGELGVRPLRTALARAQIKLGGQTKGWEPKFTFYGFRYAEITYDGQLSLDDFTAVVIASDLRRTGYFTCSHEMITKLHENVCWGALGNFVSLPMDCPQRDERLGWTGDIQVFGPTANYLYDTSAFLGGWLKDVAAEQTKYDGVPPIFVPWTPPPKDAVNPLGGHKPKAHGVWADVVAITPWDLYQGFGDDSILRQQFESMTLWLEKGVPRLSNGLWNGERPQYGDWLDPKAPPQYPAHGRTDYLLPANAYLVSTTRLVAKIAGIIGRDKEADHYREQFHRLRQEFRDEYISKNGRVTSDTQTALTLALWFDLVDEEQRQHTVDRLDFLIRWDFFKISTGFAGTPLILLNLAKHGKLDLAYRMLQEQDNPSWLYSVGMGATTIWERWDSMLPDGSVNPGQMTSFNHYALGSVANFLHTTVGGLSSLEPGWKRALIRPQPGGTVTSACTSFDSPYGPYSVSWDLEDEYLTVKVTVPPNASAEVVLPDLEESIGSGSREYRVKWPKSIHWPPRGHPGPQSVLIPDRFVE